MLEPMLADDARAGVAALARRRRRGDRAAARAESPRDAAEPEVARLRRAIPDTGRNRGSPFVVMTRAASCGRPAEGAIDRCATPS